MAKKISNKKPLSGNLVSHAENKTRTKQNLKLFSNINSSPLCSN